MYHYMYLYKFRTLNGYRAAGDGFGSRKPLRSAFPAQLLVARPSREIHIYSSIILDFKFDQSISI